MKWLALTVLALGLAGAAAAQREGESKLKIGRSATKKLELREFRYQLELGPDVAAWVLPRR